MAQSEKPAKRDFITKEIFILITPFLASYLWTIFYEAGFAMAHGIPFDFIDLNVVDILLTNRLTLLAATIAFIWIGLYYNLLPSATSPIFKGLITLLLIVSISLGFVFGYDDAKSKIDYLVANTHPESVVLKIYEDTLILAPFDRTSKIVYKSFTIRKLGEGNLQLSTQAVGPLISKSVSP